RSTRDWSSDVCSSDLAPEADSQGNNEGNTSYAIGLWGDLPYSDVQAITGVPNLIADMNSQDLAFTVHDGDLKAGNGTPNSTTPRSEERRVGKERRRRR